MAFYISSVSLAVACAEGGTLFSVYGYFTGKLGTGFHVYVGQNGDDTDELCYSGVAGQGNIILPFTDSELRCYLPTLPITTGSGHHVFVEWIPDTGESDLLSDVLEVLPPQYYTKVFDFRRVSPRYYAVGPRNMEVLEY